MSTDRNAAVSPDLCWESGNAPASQQLAARHSCRVLVVDDDLLVRTRLASLLNASQYEVELAASGREALSKLEANPCQIVLTDWQMPDMDGLALCRQVRLGVQQGYVYLLMFTIRDTEHDMLTGLAAGADAYLVKGAPTEEILARLAIGRRITGSIPLAESRTWDQRDLTHVDPVTGAHNLRYLVQQLPRELVRSQRHGHALAVLSCSIDGLVQQVNRFGRSAGDDWARDFVNRSECFLRKGDWIARTGADEFMVVLPETTAEGARCVAQKLDRLFAVHPLSTPADPVGFTVTVDVTAVETKHDVDCTYRIESLVRAALGRRFAYRRAGARASAEAAADSRLNFDAPPGASNGIN